MKKITYEPEIELRGQLLPIKTNEEKGYGCFVHMLDRIDRQLAAMLSYHSKVSMIRVDLHMNDYTPDNQLLSGFLHKLIKKLMRQCGLKRVGYVWVRERENVIQQHYHLALLVDGSKMQLPHRVTELVAELWEGMGQSHPHFPDNCAVMVRRGNAISYGDAFYRMSYLAKIRGKGYRAKYANDFFTSQIKPKSQILIVSGRQQSV